MALNTPASAHQPLRAATPADWRHRDQEKDFRDYVLLLWRRKLLLVVAAVLAGGLALVISLTTARSYEAQLVLAVGQSKLGESDVVPVNPANLRPIIYNFSIARSVVTKFKLDNPPDRLDAAKFLLRALTVEEIRGTNLIRVRVRLRDADLAARVANAIAAQATELARELSQSEAVQVRDDIKMQLDQARERMGHAEASLAAYRKQAEIEKLKSDIEGRLTERKGLVALDAEIAQERAQLARAQEELAKRPRINVVTRAIDSSPALMEAARKEGSSNVLGLELKEEQLNFVHREIDLEMARIYTKLAGLESKKRELVGGAGRSKVESAALSRLYEHEGAISRLEIERDLTRKIYTEVATQYENSRLKVASRSAQLQLIDPAYAPSTPLPRHTVRNALGGASLGFMLAVAWVLLSTAMTAHGDRTAARD